jgi:2-dehydro-3-deoxygluconokinase
VSFEVVTMGEAMLRLSVPAGERLEQAHRWEVHVAGAEANTAVALAQLGRQVAFLTRLPDNQLGRKVARELGAGGVDLSHVKWVSEGRLGLYLVELAAPPRPVTVVYDRAGSAAAAMEPDDFPTAVIDSAQVVHLTGITPALSSGCLALATQVADRVRAGPGLLTVDVNYRAKLWPPDQARGCLLGLARGADAVVLTREDARDVFGLEGHPQEVVAEARQLLEAETLVLTLGEQGLIWNSTTGSGTVAAAPTHIVDRLGAGDAFMAGVIDGPLSGDLERGLRIGAVLASLALGTRGDQVMTTRTEVERLINGGGRSIDR